MKIKTFFQMKQFQSLINLFLIISSVSLITACSGKTKTDQPKDAKPAVENRTTDKSQEKEVLEQLEVPEQLEQLEVPEQLECMEQPELPKVNTAPQSLELFDIGIYEIKPKWSTGFISLSDVYHPDSEAIPDLSEKEFEEVQYLKLTAKYRKTFLAGTKISEADTVFLYDYATDVLATFAVKSLGVIAIPSVYRSKEDWPFPQDDFMIGFEIKPNELKKFRENVSNTLVYIGKENPFIRNQLKPVKWKKIAVNDFPSTPTDSKTYSKINAELKTGYDENLAITNKNVQANAYNYEADGYQYFVKNFFIKHEKYNEIIARRLLIFTSDSQELVCEKTFIESDGTSPTPLNLVERNNDHSSYQWTGKLFKNKPPVIFGFEYASFGCPEITFLSLTESEIYINCDNRH